MTPPDPTDIGTLIREAGQYATHEMIAGPRRLHEKTIQFISSLSVHTLFNALEQQHKMSSRTADHLYLPVRAKVYRKLLRQYGYAVRP